MSHTLQSALESGQEARIVQIDFSTAFVRVNHQGILYRLSSVGIGGSVLSVLMQFFDRSLFWWMDVAVNWKRCIRSAAGQCFGPVVVPSVHLRTFLDSGE